MEQEEQQTDLEQLLSDAPAPERPGHVAEKGEIEAAPPAEQPQDDNAEQDIEDDGAPLVPRKGLIEERKKRQANEKRIAELEQELNGFKTQRTQQPPQQQQQRQQPGLPDPYEDPEGYARELDARNQRAMFETRAEISREAMMERHEDYDQAEEAFYVVAVSNPPLVQAMMQSPNPAKYAYQMGKKALAFREIGDDPTSYRARLEAEIRAKYGIADDGNEQPQPPAAQPKSQSAKAPTSLAAVPSAPPMRDNKGRYAPASLSDILDD